MTDFLELFDDSDWRGHAALWAEDSESGRVGQREVLGEFVVA